MLRVPFNQIDKLVSNHDRPRLGGFPDPEGLRGFGDTCDRGSLETTTRAFGLESMQDLVVVDAVSVASCTGGGRTSPPK